MRDQLSRLEIGGGRVQEAPDGWSLTIPAGRSGYADAQIDDTAGRRRAEFLHRPPTHLSLEARTSGLPLVGTLGFGFWNDPFPSFGGAAGSSRLWPAGPRALWFFGRWPPSDLPFAPGARGIGWCAACLDAPDLPGLAVAGLAGAATLAMLLPPLRRAATRFFYRHTPSRQEDLQGEQDTWRRYEIDWNEDCAEFFVDGLMILRTASPPKGPMGLVIWIDNQWATFSMERGLRFGVSPSDHPTWMEIRNLRLNGQLVEGPSRAS
ncbi:MAG TPA: hypothetical protein VLL77_07935 [Anaerolineales bacterium]|nr:hypothetical protein [Anaerolineales bacterium]